MHTPIEQMKYKCEFCQKGFVEKGKLDKHMMNVHLKERPYNCRYGCDIGKTKFYSSKAFLLIWYVLKIMPQCSPSNVS